MSLRMFSRDRWDRAKIRLVRPLPSRIRPKQQVLGLNRDASELARFVAGKEQNPPGSFGIPLEHPPPHWPPPLHIDHYTAKRARLHVCNPAKSRKNSDFGVLDSAPAWRTIGRVTAVTPETKLPAKASRWDSLVWPRWLPVQARLPLIAQITGAVALTALLAAPWWSSIPETSTVAETAAAARPATVPPPATAPAPAAATPPTVPASASVAPASAVPTPALAPEDLRPAHLNLEVRHSFENVDFSVTVDGKPAFQTTVEGSGKRFKVFGKRSERGYTKTIDLPPGVRRRPRPRPVRRGQIRSNPRRAIRSRIGVGGDVTSLR